MERLFAGILSFPIGVLLKTSGNNPLIVLSLLVVGLIGKHTAHKRGLERIQAISNAFPIAYLIFLLLYTPLFLIWITTPSCALAGGGGSCYLQAN